MENNYLPNIVSPDDKSVKTCNDFQFSYDEVSDSQQLRDYINIIIKRKWWIISFVVLALVSAIYYNETRTPIFHGIATLQIIQDNPSSIVSSGASKDIESALMSTDRFYETQYKLLSSRAVAYRIIESMKLVEHPQYKFLQEGAHNSSQDIKRNLADIFSGQLEITPVKNSYLVDIVFRSPDSTLAMEVPNNICKEYLKFCMETRSQSYILIREWLEVQLQQLAGKVEGSETKLLYHQIIS